MLNEQNDRKIENIFSKKVRAGKRRTYFFDVVATKNMDYFLVITESKKRLDGNGYERHKIYLYKEDFNKFMKGLNETVDYIKTELMPDFNFESFDYDDDFVQDTEAGSSTVKVENVIESIPVEAPVEVKEEAPKPAEGSAPSAHEEVDKW